MNNKHLIIGGTLAVAVALVIVFGVWEEAQAPGQTSTSTPQQATTTPTLPGEEPATTTVANGPSIGLSPYSIYIGFAVRFGTSSEAVLNKEVSQMVVGYEWEALPGSPLFDSVELPQWGAPDAQYEVQVWDEASSTYLSLGSHPAGEEVEFPRDGLIGPSKFKVLGISPALRVCPGDRSFTWKVRFTFGGNVGLVRTPLTQDTLVVPCKMR